MKANELRIGNWINDSNDIVKAELYHIQSLLDGLDDFGGVPLTEEWLVKFGFEKNTGLYNNYSMVFDEYMCSVQIVDGVWLFSNDVSDAGCYVFTDFKYVHELQNLVFALSKQELKIK